MLSEGSITVNIETELSYTEIWSRKTEYSMFAVIKWWDGFAVCCNNRTTV